MQEKLAMALLNRIRWKYNQHPILIQSNFSISDWEYGLQLADTAISVLNSTRDSGVGNG